MIRKLLVLSLLVLIAGGVVGQTLPPNQQITAFPPHAVALIDADQIFQQASTIYVGGTGDVEVIPYYPPTDTTTSVIFYSIPAGGVVPVLVKGIKAAGTTATNMVRIY